jgi:hypothetical protein
MKLLGIMSVGFDVTDQLLINLFCIRQILKENGSTEYDSVRREVMYNSLIDLWQSAT